MKILCENKRGYPAPNGTEVIITVVLVEGSPFYAAYAGNGPPEFVAAHGNKLSFKEAQIHFPIGLKEEKYRE